MKIEYTVDEWTFGTYLEGKESWRVIGRYDVATPFYMGGNFMWWIYNNREVRAKFTYYEPITIRYKKTHKFILEYETSSEAIEAGEYFSDFQFHEEVDYYDNPEKGRAILNEKSTDYYCVLIDGVLWRCQLIDGEYKKVELIKDCKIVVTSGFEMKPHEPIVLFNYKGTNELRFLNFFELEGERVYIDDIPEDGYVFTKAVYNNDDDELPDPLYPTSGVKLPSRESFYGGSEVNIVNVVLSGKTIKE